jgi:hypothetical protein
MVQTINPLNNLVGCEQGSGEQQDAVEWFHDGSN